MTAAAKRIDQAGKGVRPEADACALTILIPCLNEAETIGVCVEKAMAFLAESGIPGEVLISDNGSTDGSQEISRQLGARVVEQTTMRGYGAALNAGIAAARGRYIIMGDADDSYDLRNLSAFYTQLDAGADLVMGNRFRGGIARDAMPFLHRYLGNPVLTAIGRLLFSSPVKDFHCGLRGFNRQSVLDLHLQTTGMEFASEMVVHASLAGLRIEEVPTTLKKDGRSRPPHLRTWRDGWRHLRFLLLHSPRWTFAYPGLALLALGAVGALALAGGPVSLSSTVSVDVHTFLVACMAMFVGAQSLTFGLIARRYAERAGILPPSRRLGKMLDRIDLELLLQSAAVLALVGIGGMAWSFYSWSQTGFGSLSGHSLLRPLIVSTCAIAAAVQFAFSSFLLGILDLPRSDARGRLARLRQAFGQPEEPSRG